jgi:hypothetical protein
MNTFRKLTIAVVLIAALAVMVTPAFAQTSTRTIVKTEDEINQSYRVTNPAWRAITDRYVDLQNGQVVVEESLTRRGKSPTAVEITYVPSIENGRIFWTITSVLRDGQPASQEIIDQANANRQNSWRNWWRHNGAPGKVQSVTITDTEITIVTSQ